MKPVKKLIAAAAVLACVLNAGAASAAGVEQSVLSDDTLRFYETWKAKYLTEDPYTDSIQYFVRYGEETNDDGSVNVTVSEAHGYGMLITACMAEYDADAKKIFDGMYQFYRSHPSENGKNLMAWQQADTGSAIINVSGADSATDGDMDIAYALLLADQIWGSDGEINYRGAAVDVINDIMEYEVNKTDWILQLGDWAVWSDENDPFYAATRASDFIVQYMPVFAEAAEDDRWLNVYDSTYDIINSFTAQNGTGLLPDFIIKDAATGEFVAAPPNFLESDYDGYYYYNSCRTPWRISMDYLVNGNEDAAAFAKTVTAFIKESTNDDPWEIMAGYQPDGTAVEDYNDLCFTAPFLVAASCTDDAAWHDSVRDTVVNYGDDVYYGDTIKMLCLIADDGGWLVPDASTSEEPDTSPSEEPDPNPVYTLQDIKNLQDHLLCRPAAEDLTGKPYDLNNDGVWDVFDLALMKRECQSAQ